MLSDRPGASSFQISRIAGRPFQWSLLATLAGVALFFSRFGWKILDPRQIDWLLARNDPGSYYLIWSFFRQDPWSFPLGAVFSYLYPLGSSVPLVDGLPLFAIPLKLFAGVLPTPFQYFGIWVLLCYALQAFWGQRLARLALGDGVASLCGGVLFLLSPTFLFRQGHIALSSHWLLLAAIWIYLANDKLSDRSYYRWWGIILVTVALVHPYLAIMVLVFFLASNLSARRCWTPVRRVVVSAVGLLGVVVIWWIAGYFVGMGAESVTSAGFGKFSANLNTFINPGSLGSLLQARGLLKGQYEGYAYLGVGWILLTIVALVLFGACKKPAWRHALILVSVVLMFLFALSNKVVINETVLFEFEIPERFETLTKTFRASGRFVWPLMYLGFFWILKSVAATTRRPQLLALLGLAVVLQVLDLPSVILEGDHFRNLRYQPRLASESWDALAERASCIVAIPPFKHDTQERGDYKDICFLASRHGIPSTAGYAGRLDRAAAWAAEDSLLRDIAADREDPSQIFIVETTRFPDIYAGLGDGWNATILDGYHVCWSESLGLQLPHLYNSARPVELIDFLDQFGDETVLMTVRDDARNSMTPDQLTALSDRGIEVSSMTFRGSMAAVLFGGRCVWQVLHKDRLVNANFEVGQTFNGFEFRRPMTLVSAGYEVGNRDELIVDGRDWSFHRRGFNIVVLDADQQPTHIAYFDTAKGVPGVVVSVTARRHHTAGTR